MKIFKYFLALLHSLSFLIAMATIVCLYVYFLEYIIPVGLVVSGIIILIVFYFKLKKAYK